MTELQKKFEKTGYNSWINSDLYSNGKISTQEYIEWLEKELNEVRTKLKNNGGLGDVSGRFYSDKEIEQIKEECYQDGIEEGNFE